MKKFAIILSLLTLTFQTFAQEQKRLAVVAPSSVYMRVAPEYESALDTQELMGTIVEVTGEKSY